VVIVQDLRLDLRAKGHERLLGSRGRRRF